MPFIDFPPLGGLDLSAFLLSAQPHAASADLSKLFIRWQVRKLRLSCQRWSLHPASSRCERLLVLRFSSTSSRVIPVPWPVERDTSVPVQVRFVLERFIHEPWSRISFLTFSTLTLPPQPQSRIGELLPSLDSEPSLWNPSDSH